MQRCGEALRQLVDRHVDLGAGGAPIHGGGCVGSAFDGIFAMRASAVRSTTSIMDGAAAAVVVKERRHRIGGHGDSVTGGPRSGYKRAPRPIRAACAEGMEDELLSPASSEGSLGKYVPASWFVNAQQPEAEPFVSSPLVTPKGASCDDGARAVEPVVQPAVTPTAEGYEIDEHGDGLSFGIDFLPEHSDVGGDPVPSETGASSAAASSCYSRGIKGNDHIRGRLAELRNAEAAGRESAGGWRARLPFGQRARGPTTKSAAATAGLEAPGRKHEAYLGHLALTVGGGGGACNASTPLTTPGGTPCQTPRA